MTGSHWPGLYRAWARLPSRPRISPEVVASLAAALPEFPGRVLLLGATPDLADLGSDVTVIDASEGVVRGLWPGGAAGRRAVVGDWLRLPFGARTFGVCIGDGCLNALDHPEGMRSLLEGLARVVRPGGGVLCRVFLAPDRGETIAAVRAATLRGAVRRFQAFKFRLAMAIVAETGVPNVRVRSIHEVFEVQFGDRDQLARVTGWGRDEIDTIDVYASSTDTYSFPTRAQCLGVVPAALWDARLVPVGTYELAERYPILALRRG